MSMSKQAAKETVHTFMKYILYGNFTEAGKMFIGDMETMDLPKAEGLVYSILNAEIEGDFIFVPVAMEMGDSGKQTIFFACVSTDEGPKIHMDMTLKKTMGVSPDHLVETIKENFEDMESGLPDMPQDDPAPELYSPEFLSDAFRDGLDKIEGLLNDEIESICEILENQDLVWQVAWGTMCEDEQCPQRLLGSVIAPLRSALAMLHDHQGKIRESLKTVRILNANDHRLCGCVLKEGCLTLTPCLLPMMDRPTAPTVGFTSDQIERTIRDALDLDVGPAIKQSQAAAADFVKDCSKEIGFTPEVTIDWKSFRDSRDALTALKRLRNELLVSVLYALFHLKKKVSIESCLKSLHFRNVKGSEEQSISLDNKSLFFNLPLDEGMSGYSTEAIQKRLAELLLEPPPSPFQQMVASMKSDMMGPMKTQMSQLFGKEFRLEVDWDSMDQEEDHFNLVVTKVMGPVMGALMAMAYDPAHKAPVIAAVNGMKMRYDHAVRGVSLALENGVLNVACGGPANQVNPNPTAMGEVIVKLIQ